MNKKNPPQNLYDQHRDNINRIIAELERELARLNHKEDK